MHAKPKVPLVCKQCGETFLVHPCYAKGWKRFCSKRCHNDSMATGQDKYRGRTGGLGGEHVRIATTVERPRQRKKEPRYLPGSVLGRPLPASAEVHHVNGSYHFLLHVRARVLRAGGDPDTQRICPSCHALILSADYSQKSFGNSGGLRRPCRQCSAMKTDARRRAAGIPRKDTGRKYRYAGQQ